MKRFEIFFSKTFVILFLATSFILFSSKSAFAYILWTKVVETSEGPVTKVLFDGSNPANYPLQLFLMSIIFIVIFNLIKNRKLFDKFIPEVDPTAITLKELTEGKLPLDAAETDKALTKTIEKVRETDENFSVPTFLKYAEFLYLKTFLHRVDAEWGGSAYFFMIHVIHNLQRRFKGIKLIKSNAIISCRLVDMECYNAGTNKIIVEFVSAYESVQQFKEERFLLTERWAFLRFKGIKSPSPNTQIEFYCPVCQNESSPNMDGICPSCGKMITSGKYDWVVESAEKIEEVPFDECPIPWEYNYAHGCKKTIVQEQLDVNLEKIAKRNNDLNWESVKDIALDMTKTFYLKLFSDDFQDLKNILSPCLYNTKSFLHRRVREEKESFQIKDVLITSKKIVRADSDLFYDIVTCRLWGKILTREEGEDGKEVLTTNLFSDYVTIFKRVRESEQEWKICLIENEEIYLP